MRKDRQRAQITRAIDVTRDALEAMHGSSQKTADYIMLQQRLHDLSINLATADGGFTVVVLRQSRTVRTQPKPLRSAAIGLALASSSGWPWRSCSSSSTPVSVATPTSPKHCACPSSHASLGSRSGCSTSRRWSRSPNGLERPRGVPHAAHQPQLHEASTVTCARFC